jgi:hypothetical protein
MFLLVIEVSASAVPKSLTVEFSCRKNRRRVIPMDLWNDNFENSLLKRKDFRA